MIRRSRKKYASSTPQHVAENLLNREFAATKPNEKWVTDGNGIQIWSRSKGVFKRRFRLLWQYDCCLTFSGTPTIIASCFKPSTRRYKRHRAAGPCCIVTGAFNIPRKNSKRSWRKKTSCRACLKLADVSIMAPWNPSGEP